MQEVAIAAEDTFITVYLVRRSCGSLDGSSLTRTLHLQVRTVLRVLGETQSFILQPLSSRLILHFSLIDWLQEA